jgi:L-threonylcarbamoyladenylate synthase
MPAAVVAADGTVGTRVPNHRLALEVIERAGGAVAATSANRAGQEPARDAAGVLAALSPDLDILLDGGMTPGGVPSTVVAPDHDQLRIVREGAIPARVIDDAWREILAGHVDPAP